MLMLFAVWIHSQINNRFTKSDALKQILLKITLNFIKMTQKNFGKI